MWPIKKQIITNEAMQPTGVIISYQDWQKIEALLQQHERENQPTNDTDSSADLNAYAGSLQSLTIDPLEYQRQTRR
ncbi:MAG: hypothetical protein WBA13_09225 [Microcoleaceae cyanobacterium]